MPDDRNLSTIMDLPKVYRKLYIHNTITIGSLVKRIIKFKTSCKIIRLYKKGSGKYYFTNRGKDSEK